MTLILRFPQRPDLKREDHQKLEPRSISTLVLEHLAEDTPAKALVVLLSTGPVCAVWEADDGAWFQMLSCGDVIH